MAGASWLYLLLCVSGSPENLKSYDPVAYYVNNIEDLDEDVREAYLSKDSAKIAELAKQGETNFDIFICINKNFHAFVLCVPVGNDPDTPFPDMISDSPLLIPEQNLCWTFELCYQNVELKMYKIRKDFNVFKHLQRSEQAFYIGRYKGASPKALQFASLRASPHRYNVLLNDCVEFTKEFCIQLLSFSTNSMELKESVHDRIREATATGLSIEQLSRNIQSSGWLGNSFLNGYLTSGDLMSRLTDPVTVLGVIFLLVYPVIILKCCKR